MLYLITGNPHKLVELRRVLPPSIEVEHKKLELDEIPVIQFVAQNEMSGSSFGQFDGSIKVVHTGRHPIDVFRTLAHELVHWKQAQMGVELDGSDGSDTENEANAIAGTIMRVFGKLYPEQFYLAQR